MPEFCTCGAQLPPDALFCHRCGKPQREEAAQEEAAEPAVVPPPEAVPAAVPPGEINFHNPMAVRVAFLAAAVSSILSSLPLPILLCFVWLVGAGFFAVYLYRRRTGQTLSVQNGARLGWIAGVFAFVISTILFTLSMVTIASQGDAFGTLMREQLNQRGFPKEMVQQALDVLLSPVGLTVTILVSLAVRFISFAGITALGGALGARILGKD